MQDLIVVHFKCQVLVLLIFFNLDLGFEMNSVTGNFYEIVCSVSVRFHRYEFVKVVSRYVEKLLILLLKSNL